MEWRIDVTVRYDLVGHDVTQFVGAEPDDGCLRVVIRTAILRVGDYLSLEGHPLATSDRTGPARTGSNRASSARHSANLPIVQAHFHRSPAVVRRDQLEDGDVFLTWRARLDSLQ